MKKMLRAVVVAMLFATGAQAATVEPYVEAVPGEPGEFVFYTGTTIYPTLDPTITNYWLQLYVQSVPSDILVRSTIDSVDPATVPFRFSFAGGVAQELSMKAVIGYYDGYIDRVGLQAGSRTFGIVGSRLAEETITLSAATKQVASMPIAGSLPLLMSALGLGALVMRRRAQRAAA